MSLPRPDLHLRLSEEAMAALRYLSEIEQLDLGRVASRLLEQALLGAAHSHKVAARRALAAGLLGKIGE